MPKRKIKRNGKLGPDHVMISIRENGLSTKIADACGIKHQAISQWDRVPSTRVMVVEKITGIPRHKIRPDLYPPERERRVA